MLAGANIREENVLLADKVISRKILTGTNAHAEGRDTNVGFSCRYGEEIHLKSASVADMTGRYFFKIGLTPMTLISLNNPEKHRT